MNKERKIYKMPDDHNHIVRITPYWLLGFIEGEGYFLFKKNSK